MTRWDKMLNEMFRRKDHVNSGKQDPEKINGSDYEVPMNNSKLVIKKAKAKVDIEESKVKA